MTACSSYENNATSAVEQEETSESGSIRESFAEESAVEESAVEESAVEESPVEESPVVNDANESAIDNWFISDNPDLVLNSVSINGPMYEVTIENKNKVYEDLIEGDYPNVEFALPESFAAVAAWPDKNHVYLQFWNINNEKEAIFDLDGDECKIDLQTAEYSTKPINITVNAAEESYDIQSIDIYKEAAVITIPKPVNNTNISQDEFDWKNLKLKSDHGEIELFRVHMDHEGGEIKILYILKDEKGNDEVLEVEGIVYNHSLIFRLK